MCATRDRRETMTKYTLSTEEVSRRYMLGAWEESGDTSGDDVAQFDRWLASVKADAWRLGFYKGMVGNIDPNPYEGVDDE
jgi:hypothetical protein